MFALYSSILFTHLVLNINYLLIQLPTQRSDTVAWDYQRFYPNMISIILDHSSKFIVILHSLKHTCMPDSLINCRTGSRHWTRRTRAGDQGLSRTPLHSLCPFFLDHFSHTPFFSPRIRFKMTACLVSVLASLMTVTVATEDPKSQDD